MVPVIKMDFAPVKGGFIRRTWDIPVTTQRVVIETPYGDYDALVGVLVAREVLQIDDIRRRNR